MNPDFHSESTRIARNALIVLTVAVGGLAAWATWVPLAEGVPAAGFVTGEEKRKPVQHLVGGRVQRVLVREGGEVTEGQPLIELEDSVARSTLEAARQQYFNLLATHNRLIAERASRNTIDFSPELLQAAAELPQINTVVSSQRKLLAARNGALRSQIATLQERIEGERTKLAGYRQTAVNLAEDHANVSRQIDRLEPLVRDSYAPRNQLLDLERERSRVANQRTETETNARTCLDNELELKAQIKALREQRRQDIETAQADVVRDLKSAEAHFHAASTELDTTVIRSPTAGQVVGLLSQTPGTIVQPGERILDVVPRGTGLVVEAHVAPHLVDRLVVGQPADLRFSAFAHSPLLVVNGRLETLSADVLLDPEHGQPYYLARVSVTPDGVQTLSQHDLRPGLPAEVVFRTGTRTMLSYLVDPLARRLSTAMVEE